MKPRRSLSLTTPPRVSPTPAAAGSLSPEPYRVSRSRLPNGLRVVTIETPHLHAASIALYAGVGARYETRRTNGLSHFVEHMLFRGSARFPDSYTLNRAIEIQEESATRLSEEKTDSIATKLAILHFESPEAKPAK